MYSLSHDDAVNALIAGGNKRTIIFEGDTGVGKSALLSQLAKQLPGHVPCYFDCTTKDLGDITIPRLIDGTPEDTEERGYVKYYTNEELGAHLTKPIILMIDEIGKANNAVKNSMMRPMLERVVGTYPLHKDSIVFCTTNLGAEGLGDMFLPHQLNRVTRVRYAKPDADSWIEWGINNEIDHTLLGWAKDTPQLFQSFTDVGSPEDNPYIYHPQDPSRTSFVTPRSLEAASDWMKVRHEFSDNTLTALLIGTIGARGAMDLSAFVKLADTMPTRAEIAENPRTAKIPDSAAGVCMVVFRTLSSMEKDYINPWMDYVLRLNTEAQGMFANGVRSEKYNKRSIVLTNQKFTKWAIDNNYLFAADKK
jgi:hypothetical protein